MSEQEFETYLKLLCSLLRLNPQQRDEIAAELREHLEERVVDLRESGLSQQDAVAQALEEFGDVAGLATEFSRIGKRKYRRWMMRMATVSVTAAFMVIMLFVSQWPEGGRVALAPPAGGQDVEETVVLSEEQTTLDTLVAAKEVLDSFGDNQTNPFGSQPNTESKPKRHLSVAAKDRLTRARLEETCNLEFNGITIDQLVALMHDELPYGAIVNTKALEGEGLDTSSGDMTWAWPNQRMATMLEILLEEMDLTYYIHDGMLVITTKKQAEDSPHAVVYDISLLLYTSGANSVLIGATQNSVEAKNGEGPHAAQDSVPMPLVRSIGHPAEIAKRQTQLINLLQTTVEPLSWEDNGGPAGVLIAIADSKLIVRNTERVQRRIAQLLESIQPE